MPTELAIKRHREWEAFIKEVSVVVEEAEPGRFTYYLAHPTKGENKEERGSFTSREAALASGQAVIALKWPEPALEP